MSYARNRRQRLIRQGRWHPALNSTGQGATLAFLPAGSPLTAATLAAARPVRGIRDLRFTMTEEMTDVQ